MSLLSRKQDVDDVAGVRGHAMTMARQAMPAARNVTSTAAQQAVPLARSAATSVKQSADSAIAQATPLIGAARHWTAPWLEQSAAALTETIAPMISDALITAAHKIDYVEPKPRRGKGRNSLFVVSMLLIAAGAATGFMVLHRQETEAGYTAATPGPDGGGPGLVRGRGNGQTGPADAGLAEADGDGHPPMS